jgi:hypothetical protein
MITQAFRNLPKLFAVGNCILVHHMTGIFESLANSLGLIEIPEQWFLILLLTIYLLLLGFASMLSTFFV